MSQNQKVSVRARRKAREMALQALYQLSLSGGSVTDVEKQYIEANDTKKTDIEYFRELLHGVMKHVSFLDKMLEPLIDRPFEQLDPVEKAILRLGCFEFMHRPDIPYRVVINEAIEIAKRFGAQESHKYVNGILDKLSAKTRTAERHKKTGDTPEKTC